VYSSLERVRAPSGRLKVAPADPPRAAVVASLADRADLPHVEATVCRAGVAASTGLVTVDSRDSPRDFAQVAIAIFGMLGRNSHHDLGGGVNVSRA
jgi:hypothetical protein